MEETGIHPIIPFRHGEASCENLSRGGGQKQPGVDGIL